MTRSPDGHVPLEGIARKFGITPRMLRFPVATGALTIVQHEGKLWVLRKQFELWVAAEPECPFMFGETLGARFGDTPLTAINAPADAGNRT